MALAPKFRNWLRTLGAPEDPVATDTSSEWSAMSLLKAIYGQLAGGGLQAALVASLTGASASSVAIATGAKSFTASTGKSWVAGQWLNIASTAAPTVDFMNGPVTSYDTITGALVMNIDNIGGSGTHADWVISLSGTQGETATIEIGTVSIVAAGQPATVVNSGNETAAVFDFEIPQGPAGEVVSTGASTANNLAKFLDTSGDVIGDAGVAVSTDGTLASNSDVKLPTEKAVKTYADSIRTAILNGVSSAFDTLAEIATELALKATLASPTFTGTPAGPTAAVGTNSTQLATTAFSVSNIQTRAQGFSMLNGTLVPSVGASALTIAIKTLAGANPSSSDPVTILFRNATAATGDYTAIVLTAATSLVISSGSTMGASSATAFRLWIVGFNDAGTFRLGAINCRSSTNIYPLEESALKSSTAEGGAGAADSACVIYTGTAVTTKPMCILGFMTWDSGLTAAGTWDATPSTTQLFSPGVYKPGDAVQSFSLQLDELQTFSSVTHTNTTIDGISSTATLKVGMHVSGTNVAANTVITVINNSTTITVNNATTGSATNNLSYGWQTDNATTSYVDSYLTGTMTLMSPANSVSFSYCTTTLASAISVAAYTNLSRGGVPVSPKNGGAFSAAGLSIGPSSGGGSDFPGSVGPHTYTVRIRSSTTTSVSMLDANGGAFLQLSEIMC